ncbi:protein kinase [Streptomyces sp. NPDC002054]|uniref:protein kinase n=1 Tax=Streptomyces sp. NPDC002054 TaxID=3154663 RepID=UPI003324D1C7
MEDYAGRILADRYRLPLPPSDAYELIETRAFDTRSGQEVLIRQVPLPEVVDAELLDGGRPAPAGRAAAGLGELPAVRRAIEAAQAAARIPDHPRLDQVFDVFAEDGSLWIVSELVPARPLAALIAEEPLSPYRAAEVASDVLTALRVLHAHGWTHRNITVRTVLICDDGRVVLTGLAAGAAEEALCGYDPVPAPDLPAAPLSDQAETPWPAPEVPRPAESSVPAVPVVPAVPTADLPRPEPDPEQGPAYADRITPGQRAEDRPDLKAAARAGAVAAYRAGAQAAARVTEERRATTPDRQPEPRLQGSKVPQGYSYPYGGGPEAASGSWHGATPRRAALPAAPEPDLETETEGGPEAAPETAQPAQPAPIGVPPVPYARPAAALPAQLALPQGYRQAEDRAEDRAQDRAEQQPYMPAPVIAQAPAQAPDPVPVPAPAPARSGWGAEAGPGRGLAAERARQTRIAVVGAVTERWAPEQARPVHGTWQLAAPVGPATDLWALGALLYRSVQGHAPYPEESAAELVEMVCAEPPAFAEECGPLRPVVESLLRQDPTERPEFEELRGWLRSLVRSAPEPEGEDHPVPLAATDPARLPVVRRRGELHHGRHRQESGSRRPRSARSLGRNLLLGILLALAALVAFAMFFLPKADQDPAGNPGPAATPTTPGPGGGSGGSGGSSAAPQASTGPETKPSPDTGTGTGTGTNTGTGTGTGTPPAGSASAPPGYTLAQDPEGFEVLVPAGWERTAKNDAGQVRYSNGDYELIVVPGRDAVQGNPDPLAYQKDKERELEPFRSSTWATSTGTRQTRIGQKLTAEGTYTWTDATGRSLYVRNHVAALAGRYHVVMVLGPQDGQEKVTEVHGKATGSYRLGR